MQIGQLIYRSWYADGKSYYDIGFAKEVYDDVILVYFKHGKKIRSVNIDEVNTETNGELVKELMINGKPAFAKKNIFGRYKI
jgi:hypothetical protein